MEGSEKHRRREGWRHHFTPSLVQRRETKPPTYHQLKHLIDFEEGTFCNKEDGERGGTCTHVTHPNWSPSVGAGGETMQTNKLPQCLSGESKDAFKSFFGAIFFFLSTVVWNRVRVKQCSIGTVPGVIWVHKHCKRDDYPLRQLCWRTCSFFPFLPVSPSLFSFFPSPFDATPRTLQPSIFISTLWSFFWKGKPAKKSHITLLLNAFFFKQRLLSAPQIDVPSSV